MELTVILSDGATPFPAGTARYGRELSRALIATASPNSVVRGFAHRLGLAERAALLADLPGLTDLTESALSRRLLARAWSLPLTDARLPGPTVLAPSLFAPLAAQRRQRDRDRRRLTVTIHDLVPFTHPETLTPRGVRWHRAQIRAAQRWADAILVPSEAVAAGLRRFAPAGDRVHVVPAAASLALRMPASASAEPSRERATIVFLGTIEPRKGLDVLIEAMSARELAEPHLRDLQLVVVGASGWGAVDVTERARQLGLAPDRIVVLGRIEDAALAEVISCAHALVLPSRAEGFGLPVIEAMALGTPVIHSLDPALVETAGGAGVGVDVSGDRAAASQRLATAIAEVALDPALRARLRERGLRRAADFSWEASAARVWNLLAD